MQILIRPVDVWLFRDGRPFRAGEDHLAVSLFPPTPFTLQGAIRTKALVDKGIDVHDFVQYVKQNKPYPEAPEIGFGDNFGDLRLLGPLLARRNDGYWERLLPMPADVTVLKDDKTQRFALLRPEGELPFTTNLPDGMRLLWVRTDLSVEERRFLFPEKVIRRYLRGEMPDFSDVIPFTQPFDFEPRFGIAIDRGRGTAEAEKLYQARFVRLRDEFALWAEVEGVELQPEGYLRFGGEGKAAYYWRLEPPLHPLQSEDEAQQAVSSGRFKVVLVTPAWFSDGWRPRDGDWQGFLGAPVRLAAAALPKAQLFGGFDIAKGKPKPMRAFVPTGAVYFFEVEGGRISLNELVRRLWEGGFTETPDEVRGNRGDWAQIGLGKVLIGRW